MIHQLKGTKKGLETVLSLLRSSDEALELYIVGNPEVTNTKEVSDFSKDNYVSYSNFNIGSNPFDITFQITTGNSFNEEQCIASSPNYGFYLGITTTGKLILRLGRVTEGIRGWQTFDDEVNLVSSKTLSLNTVYTITFSYSGYGYSVRVSSDNDKYLSYIAVDSSIPLDIGGENIILGLDYSTNVAQFPFKGIMHLDPFSVASNNVTITQWFERIPVEAENTYEVEAEMDVGIINSNFFLNFAKFAQRFVYPTLKAFRAKLVFKNKVTFLPYVRQKVTYIATNGSPYVKEYFNVYDSALRKEVPFKVETKESASTSSEDKEYEDFIVVG